MHKKAIQTQQAPAPIGAYSQAICVNNTVYLSGQIPVDPQSGEIVSENPEEQIEQTFKNLAAVATAAHGTLDHIVKLNIFLTDLADVPIVNTAIKKYFSEPYPARSTVRVVALPKNVKVEIEAVMVIGS